MPKRFGEHDVDVELATFDPSLAHAVVRVLRRAGIPALEDEGTGETRVLVAQGRRDESLALLAARMEEIRDEARGPALAAEETAGLDDGSDEMAHPLVFERLRRFGLLVVALVPLLVITLANVRLPMAYAAAVLVGGMAFLLAWRNGRFS